MPRTPKDPNQAPKKRGKPAAQQPAEDELLPTTSRPAEQEPAGSAEAEAAAAEIREGAAKMSAIMQLLGYEETGKKRRPAKPAPAPGAPVREDASRNRAEIRKVMLRYIKNLQRLPTVQEICEETGLSDKTVKAHRKHIKLGDGSANMYQALTHDVIMAIFKKARGYTYDSEKLLVVSGGKDMGSEVERHEIIMHVQPDMSAAKLWLQAIEGMSEKTDTKHSGEIKGGGGFHFEYVAPAPPAHE